MEEVNLKLNDNNEGAFYIMDGSDLLGEMVISISGNTLTVFHTEVSPKAEGRGFAKRMLEAMVSHARENNLKVLPLCPFVQAQFKRHPDEYADIWEKPRVHP